MGKSGLVKERCKALDFNYWRFGFKDNSHEINVVNSLMAIIIQRESSGNSTRRDDRVYRQHRPMNLLERDRLFDFEARRIGFIVCRNWAYSSSESSSDKTSVGTSANAASSARQLRRVSNLKNVCESTLQRQNYNSGTRLSRMKNQGAPRHNSAPSSSHPSSAPSPLIPQQYSPD